MEDEIRCFECDKRIDDGEALKYHGYCRECAMMQLSQDREDDYEVA